MGAPDNGELLAVGDDVAGLGEMLADLIRSNLEREPDRRSLILDGPATINLIVRDADVAVGMRFTGEALHIDGRLPRAQMTVTCDTMTLMELTNVPLRFGMPDQLKPEGRRIAAKLLNGEIQVKGLPKQLPLMIRMQRLFTVSS